jgi:triacylglycerol lipase
MTDLTAGSRRWRGHPVREFSWMLENAALFASPVWLGYGVPRGNGAPVLLVPGFLAVPGSLLSLRHWLRRMGHGAHLSGITWNVECANRHLDHLRHRLEDVAERTGRPVTLVGHSRGGSLCYALAGVRPDLVARVVTLGSPLADEFDISRITSIAVSGARIVEHARHAESRRAGCFTANCTCAYTRAKAAMRASSVPVTTIVTRDDGIVHPRACTVPGATVHEVRGSHLGLAVNPAVYRILGRVLAETQ